ncbi:PEGA domain-containing protein [Psychromonas antarctica]|uniref:PEGA domain-containing protein n=1 Tax=Psychromonas antarctica TaxID=67573 RepID=UPI001EE887D7|nr:PEGA domain-containing protein [Psychromonas antarctica]MCG6201436.1 PEGA domain-containing protein [Psychromonas antarctica]
MQQNDSALISFTLRWLLVTQPLVQPIGSSINNTLKIAQGFNAISGPLDRFDLKVMRERPITRQPHPVNKLLPLNITTNIKGARIAIMNIKPKYQAGMKLPPGSYKVRVSAPGYTSVNKFIYLKPDHTNFNIKL